MNKEFNDFNSNYYLGLFKKYGVSPKSLGWNKGKQFLRFDQLTKDYNLDNRSFIDVGCGFGDFASYLKTNDSLQNISYLGIDLIDEFIQIAEDSHKEDNFKFINGDFLETNFKDKFDYAISSGIFNLTNSFDSNYDMIRIFIEKMLLCCTKSISIDFLSDQVDFTHDHTFHSNPSKILSIAYEFSRNVSLSNDYFPFEFTLRINKDDSFNKNTTIFNTVIEKMKVSD